MTDYYAALQEAWELSSAAEGALPDGVEGTSLFGLSTDEKIVAVNAWLVTGSVPAIFPVSGADLWNCVNWTELEVLTDEQRKDVIGLCQIQGQFLVGSDKIAFATMGMFTAYFPSDGPTIAALTAIGDAQMQFWWSVSVADGGGGLTGVVSHTDVTAAGLS